MAKGGSGYSLTAGGGRMPNTVNTGFALDMQRKLYRWSLSDKSKVFSDLFNLVCDRRMLMHAWRRLSNNSGSNTPGTDGLTRRRFQEQAGGEAVFLEETHKDLKEGPYRAEPVRQRL